MSNRNKAFFFTSLAGTSGFPNEYCLEFDGTGDILSWGKDPSLCGVGTTDFSVSFWLNADSFQDWDVFMSRVHFWPNFGWYLYVSGTAPAPQKLIFERSFYAGGPGITLGNGIGQLDTGVWQHITFTYNGTTGVRKIYLDGVLSEANAPDSGITFRNDDEFVIGSNPDPSKMDEVAYWNEELSVSDILEVFGDAGGSGGKGNGAVVDLNNLDNANPPHAWIRMGDLGTFVGADPNGQWLIPEYSNAT